MKPNERVETLAGVAGTAYTLELSAQYITNLITFVGTTAGIMTIRAKESNNTSFERVENGSIDLSDERTIRISGYQLKELEFTQTESQAFTVYVTQSDPIEIT